MPCVYPLDMEKLRVPETMVKDFMIETSVDGEIFTEAYREKNNYQRLVKAAVECRGRYVRLTPAATWGSQTARVFSWDVY